ncbi:hypothetical protein Scep_009785 [Stephania cephalantha]|uniref:RING-type E3 ubiquitin transferase n=1 Tax=Stephania cephalantha TaxID=152367 RepID=A0AAP0JUM4_9MAGN
MMALELLPIGTFLALLTGQVIKTAVAAKDVLIEKESFKALSKYLLDIKPILEELQRSGLNDSQAARQALESLEKDIKKASDLVEKYKNRSRFYLLVKCRHIVKEAQDATRNIGRSLATLSLASTEVLAEISEQVTRLHNEMQRAEFEASQTQVQIVEKLDEGLLKQKLDQGFANNMLEQIALAVGVPIVPSEISKELADFRREIEEAAVRKEREEEYFLGQVIKLLSQADAARNQEEIKNQYYRRMQSVERTSGDYIPPLQSFICPLSGSNVMVDPVSLCTGTTYERASIEAWFESGEKTDPETGDFLEDLSLRSNHRLRQSIEEWRELNFCLKIRSAKRNLQSGIGSSVEDALSLVQDVIRDYPVTRDWIAIEGIIDIVISILSTRNKDIKISVLMTLKVAVEGHQMNKDRVVESGGMERIVTCLLRSSNVSKAAVELLYELVRDGSGWNTPALKKLSQHSRAILFLVMFLNTESADMAEAILLKLCSDDDSNIIRAADANWFKPVVSRLIEGPEDSKLLIIRALVEMELMNESVKCLGEAGVIPPLLQMLSTRSFEVRELALSLLVKLLSCQENKKLIAASGGVPVILNQMHASHVRTIIIARCCEIIEKLSSNEDGIQFLVDENGVRLDLEQTIANLLALQQNCHSSLIVRRPALGALLDICKSEAKLVKKAVVGANGVSVILPLLDDSNQEIREITLKLLFYFSHHEAQGVADFLLEQRRMEALVGFLQDDTRRDTQTAAAGLLANLPKSEIMLTKKLIESDGLNAVLKILKSGTMEAKENALGVLFRFTDPTTIETQRMVVESGVYPLLVDFLKTGTVTAKAWAAALIGNLSLNTPKLATIPRSPNCWSFRSSKISICEVHEGICNESSTFCLIKANAMPAIVNLLREKVHETAYEALKTLLTLVYEDRHHRGVDYLDKADAINPILEVLSWGTTPLKAEALGLLEKVFVTCEMAENYGPLARIGLLSITTQNMHENDQLTHKANRVLMQLDRFSKSSMPLL